MGKLLPKFRINLRWAAIIIVVMIAVPTLTGNILLNQRKASLLNIPTQSLSYGLTAQNIVFVFPNTLILSNVTLQPTNDLNPKSLSIHIPLLALQFSLWDLMAQRPIEVPTIVINRLRCTQTAFLKFLQENGENLITMFSNLPRTDVHILIKEAQIHPAGSNAVHNSLLTNFSLRLKRDIFTGHGTISHIIQKNPLSFDLKGRLLPNGLRLEHFMLEKTNLSSNFWGEIKGDILSLNGYAFYGPQPKTDPIIELIDLDCQVRLGYPHLEIDRLNLSFNHFPIAIKGTILFSSPLRLNLAAVLTNATAGPHRINNLQQAELNISGIMDDNIFKAKTWLNFIYEKSKDSSFALDKISVTADPLMLYFDPQKRFTAQLRQGSTTITTVKSQHKVAFDDLKARFNFSGEKFKIADITAALYEGRLQGRVWCDITQLPVRLSASASMADITAHSLSEMLVYFEKINGKLSGKLNVQSHPSLKLSGEALIQDGTLNNFDFFKWMADTFGMSSLINIPFVQTTTQFWLDAQGSGIKDIKISSENVGLEGYFSVDKNSLVSSKLSLSLGRSILQESPKFRAILKMFDQEVPSLTFDFQLSGNQDAMNFQWLQSEFKERIQSRIPNFIERMIDRNIDAILEGNIPAEPAGSTQ